MVQTIAHPVSVGDPAPDFSLPDQDGKSVKLSDYRGKIVVLFFYPKDFSPGCTKEICAFGDAYDVFRDEGAELLGVSSDTVESHKRFAEDHHLQFHILSDQRGKVRELYKVPSTLGMIPGRATYVIDKNGKVRHVFISQFKPEMHMEEALRVIREINKG
jgi:peroxiredoxin Q/BCP